MEYARSRALQPVNRVGINLAGPTLLAHGTDGAEAALVARRSSTRRRSGASSSASPRRAPTSRRLRTTATPVEGGWILDGQKVWTSYAQFARWGICLARTDPDAPKHQGISLPRRRHGGRRASRSDRSSRSRVRRSSTRCSSTMCSYPTTTSSAGCTKVGRWRTRPSPTSGGRRSRSRSRSCTRCTSTSSTGSPASSNGSTTWRSPTRSPSPSSSFVCCACTTGERCRGCRVVSNLARSPAGSSSRGPT